MEMEKRARYNKRASTGTGPMNIKRAPGLLLDKSHFSQWECNVKKGPDYLVSVQNFVSTYKCNTWSLKNPCGARLTIGDLDDTIYKGKKDELDGWGKFYLPQPVSMQVVGVVKGVLCPWGQLVLMTCEDRHLYAYDGELLHDVASSPDHLFDTGIMYPAAKSYYDGEAFKDVTQEQWDKVRSGPVGKSLDNAHHKLVMAKKSRFMENLKSNRKPQGAS